VVKAGGARAVVQRALLSLEAGELPLEVGPQRVGHVVGEAPLDDDPESRQVGPLLRERVGGYEPAPLAQCIRDVEDREVVDP
jgi:hypothetical protein